MIGMEEMPSAADDALDEYDFYVGIAAAARDLAWRIQLRCDGYRRLTPAEYRRLIRSERARAIEEAVKALEQAVRASICSAAKPTRKAPVLRMVKGRAS